MGLKRQMMTDEEVARTERNRQRALLIRNEKMAKLSNKDYDVYVAGEKKQSNAPSIDSGAGFLSDTKTNRHKSKANLPSQSSTSSSAIDGNKSLLSICLLCKKQFMDSFLKDNFDYAVCDLCRDPEEKHTLITRTEAKNRYLLKDCDLDLRPPPLRFLLKRNRKEGYNRDMKLYLQLQVELRALEVWGSEEKIEEQFELREQRTLQQKDRKYRKEMNELRKQVQAQHRMVSTTHVHEYGSEQYDEKRDLYQKVCKTCGHVNEYEKL